MKLGEYDIPDVRLVPTTIDTLGEIYRVKKREKVPSKDLAIFLGFKYGTEPHYYRKIHSMSEYGLIEGKGIFQISELGEKILHPRDDHEKALALTTAVLNIPLWKAIFQKHGKKPRGDNFWAVLVDITKVDPDTAKNNAMKVIGWYMADVTHVSDDLADHMSKPSELEENEKPKGLSSTEGNIRQMSQQMTPLSGMQIIYFDKYQVALPEGDLKKEWEKLKKYMEIKLEDYKYQGSNSVEKPQA